ncbi:hypothetical protein BDK51DRAFT_41671 [Blyttiomyces helicus]|uniref:Uncharacterized protein n=1 Tax=Blyttiomyces helicus TaxID=388810 RepID=A0A4P9WNJ4_9FUNG|nr:hypothetical protein BDK51DRAFT_41671 [Blyttiomyces helicus]|eukprot:RKO94062.1 hypothetical protein BDK51DRAFT_41671 [Blyttiomyces helicus]
MHSFWLSGLVHSTVDLHPARKSFLSNSKSTVENLVAPSIARYPFARHLISPALDNVGTEGSSAPTLSIAQRLPLELLRQVFRELPDSQDQGCGGSDLRFAALVCRDWEPVVSKRIWTHVVVRTRATLEQPIDCSRASAARSERAVLVRSFEIFTDLRGLNVSEDFVRFVPQLRGLRAFIARSNPFLDLPVAAVAALLSSCPHLVVVDIIVPQYILRSESESETETEVDDDEDEEFDEDVEGNGDNYAAWDDEEALEAKEADEGDDSEVALSAGCLENGGDDPRRAYAFLEDTTFRARSFGSAICFFGLLPEAIPQLVIAALPSLEILEITNEKCEVFFASLIKIRPPLRHLDLSDMCFDSQNEFAALPRACPSVTELDITSSLSIPETTLALLDIARYLTSCVDDDLLACIAESTPQLEFLNLREYFDYGLAPTVVDVAFIADLKRGCPNLRTVELNISRDFYPDEKALQFVTDLGVDIFGFVPQGPWTPRSFLLSGFPQRRWERSQNNHQPQRERFTHSADIRLTLVFADQETESRRTQSNNALSDGFHSDAVSHNAVLTRPQGRNRRNLGDDRIENSMKRRHFRISPSRSPLRLARDFLALLTSHRYNHLHASLNRKAGAPPPPGLNVGLKCGKVGAMAAFAGCARTPGWLMCPPVRAIN